MSKPLKLLAESPADMTVLSAVIQDMTIKLSDMAYLPRQHRFAFVGNRFRWEKSEPSGDAEFTQANERVRAACRFENVLRVASKGMPQNDKAWTNEAQKANAMKDHVLGVLNLEVKQHDNGDFDLTLHFYGGGTMKLVCECLEIYVEDLSLPWTTAHRPDHGPDNDGHGPDEEA